MLPATLALVVDGKDFDAFISEDVRNGRPPSLMVRLGTLLLVLQLGNGTTPEVCDRLSVAVADWRVSLMELET
jgi:hypothetical protein